MPKRRRVQENKRRAEREAQESMRAEIEAAWEDALLDPRSTLSDAAWREHEWYKQQCKPHGERNEYCWECCRES